MGVQRRTQERIALASGIREERRIAAQKRKMLCISISCEPGKNSENETAINKCTYCTVKQLQRFAAWKSDSCPTKIE